MAVVGRTIAPRVAHVSSATPSIVGGAVGTRCTGFNSATASISIVEDRITGMRCTIVSSAAPSGGGLTIVGITAPAIWRGGCTARTYSKYSHLFCRCPWWELLIYMSIVCCEYVYRQAGVLFTLTMGPPLRLKPFISPLKLL